MDWRPLLDESARAHVLAIVRKLATTVEGDTSDHALLRYYLAQDDAVPDRDGAASQLLSASIAALTERAPFVALHGGIAGVGWAVAHVAGGDDAEGVCAAIDATLLRELPRTTRFDVIAGIAGIGIYALERGSELATRVIDELERRATPRGTGLAWFSSVDMLPEHQYEQSPHGHWDLGIAHGSAGVIALLARYLVAEVEVERARPLLDAAVSQLLAENPADVDGRYPAWHELDGRTFGDRRRLAWCYGDLGMSIALLAAAIARGRDDWRREALALGSACARRTPDLQSELGMCHGAFGIAHLFNRLHHATEEAAFAEAARCWCERGLATLAAAPDHELPDHTLLNGTVGIALALHALTSEVEPDWDRVLLVDL